MPQQLAQSQPEEWYRFARALQASQEGLWDWDLVAERLWGSSRWQSLTGVHQPCSQLSAWMDRIHPLDKPRFEAELRALRAGKSQCVHNEHRVRQQDGHWRWVLARGVASRDTDGRITHVAGSVVDNTEHRTADALTGLPNRVFFADYLERRIDRARATQVWDFAVLAIALDRFDRVNESLGSTGAERLLMETALHLQSVLSGDSLAARLNGPEFIVCLEPAHSEADAIQQASVILESFREPFVWRGHRVAPQLAIGIATPGPGCAHPEDLMSDAQSALNRARRNEPRDIVAYSSGMRERTLDKLDLEADLERAIHTGGLTLHYQPEVDLRTGRIVGFEALVRWRHERRGLLPPSAFIPLAEETGLILPLGDWGLSEACRQLVRWRSSPHPDLRNVRVSVNLSARQFESADLVSRVRRVLEETRLGPGSLRLEVTESTLIADAPAALGTMRALAALGVGLHMDDFGIGYSTLHSLQRFPFDTLKIDRSFVRGMITDHESRQIVANILDLARSFGLDVVAEGIEDEQQLKALKSMGCPCGQGYYFARPMESAAIDAFLHSGVWRPEEPALLPA